MELSRLSRHDIVPFFYTYRSKKDNQCFLLVGFSITSTLLHFFCLLTSPTWQILISDDVYSRIYISIKSSDINSQSFTGCLQGCHNARHQLLLSTKTYGAQPLCRLVPGGKFSVARRETLR